MITKVIGFRNKYLVVEPTSKEEFEKFLTPHAKTLKCFISNPRTAKMFDIALGEKYCTINNKIEDNVFYLNGVY